MSDSTPPLNTVPAVGTTPHYCVQTEAARRRQMSDNTPPLNTVPAVGTTPHYFPLKSGATKKKKKITGVRVRAGHENERAGRHACRRPSQSVGRPAERQMLKRRAVTRERVASAGGPRAGDRDVVELTVGAQSRRGPAPTAAKERARVSRH